MKPTRLVPAAVIGLVLAGLGVLTVTPPAAAETFHERWCVDGFAAPCLVSATRNGVPLTSADPDIEIQMVGVQTLPSRYYTAFLVQRTDALQSLDTADTYSLTFDLGTLEPDVTESYSARPTTDRYDDGDGTYRARFTGKPVLLTTGCNDSFPIVCSETATSERILLEGDIAELRKGLDLTGFDQSQNVDVAYLVFNSETPTSPAEIESTWGNSHFLSDGTTVVRGEARFRLPYHLLTSSFGIPDPGTMTSGSLAGTINGSPAAFGYTHDPAGGAMFVDISGVTFSKKTIRLRTGTVTPTRSKVTKSKRVTPRKARVGFTEARARGAKVQGYQLRCRPTRAPERYSVVSNLGKRAHRRNVTVVGLKPGARYACQVRAKSKVGPGKWSRPKLV